MLPVKEKYHYTYYSYEEFGRGYIGSRQSKVPPEQDTRYMGSFYDRSFKPTQKIILATHYNTKEEALTDESILHKFFDVVANPHFVNQVNAGEKFYRTPEDARNDRKRYWEGLTLEEQKKIVEKMQSGMTPEKIKERSNKLNRDRSPELKKKTAEKISKRLKEYWSTRKKPIIKKEKIAIIKKEKKPAAYQLWQCTITGYASTLASIAQYQRARGIDKSNRVRLDQ
tara:strand:+ start:894 stop:1571 length:678 start_codon:yes stop_codon:yes gene_type:complete